MALTQTLAQIRSGLRSFTNTGGTTALLRHPDASLNDYINRALGSLHRKLTEALPDQRFLSSSVITTVLGTSVYSLPADFDHLISVDLTANGTKQWLIAYEMNERPGLTDPSASFQGIPYCYRLRGSNYELLPVPQAVYTGTLWYVPTTSQLASDGATFDTISRLDDYIIAHAAQPIFMRDQKLDQLTVARQLVDDISGDIMVLARSRDKNSPARIIDEDVRNRWGRRSPMPRRWR